MVGKIYKKYGYYMGIIEIIYFPNCMQAETLK